MRRAQSSERERRLQLERSVKYRGTARVRLDHLHFEWGEARELSQKNVERLKRVFRTEKIQRLEPRNHIPAVVPENDLNSAVQDSKIPVETLLSNPDGDFPVLKFPRNYKLTCLHGGHRIQAARETLPPTDAWWTVDLYLTDTNPELRATLVEEYSNQSKPSDGEIYRKIRQYEREGNVCFKKRWKARLSSHGRRSLQQLFNHGDGELTAAFDNLLDIPGLWDGMRISTLHKMIGMKCDEEVLHYLEHVREVWHRLLRGDKAALQKVDQDTVKALELRAPRYSRRESLLLYGQILSGQIFGSFSREEREEIWLDLRSMDGLIPSLFTFFEDLKYLSAPADCLKQLIHVSRGDTLRTAFQRKFAYSDVTEEQSVIEVAESTFSVRAGAKGNRFDLCYRQLWLFAMRHYKAIPSDASKKGKDLLAKAGPEKADEAILSDFVVLAQRLGFESKEIQELSRQSSDWQIARNALLKARKPDRYRYNQTDMEDYIAQIVELFMTATPLPVEPLSPVLVSGDPDAAGNRCGFPDEDAQEQDSRFLFLPYLHDEGSDEVGQEITSFFVRRSVYQAFFGKISNLAFGKTLDYLPRGYAPSNQTIISTSELSQANDMEWTNWQISRTTQPEPHETGGQHHERLEQQQVESGRLERLKQQRLEGEQREKEQREKEQREKEQREKEQREKEQREKEQREKEQHEKEQSEKEQREKEQREKEQREKEQREKEQHEKEQREKEQLEKEQREQEQQRLELLVLRRLQQEHEKDRLEKDQHNQEGLERRRLGPEKFDQESAMHESLRQKSVASGGEHFRHLGVDAKKPPLDDKRHTSLQKPVNQSQVPEQRVAQRGLNSNPKPTNLKPTKKYGGGVLRSDEDNDSRNPRTLMNNQSATQRGRPSIGLPAQQIQITFRIRERGEWRIAHTLDVDPSDTSAVERMAVKYMRKQIRVFDTNLHILTPRNCFEAAIADGRNTILLIRESDINIDGKLEASVTKLEFNNGPSDKAGIVERGR